MKNYYKILNVSENASLEQIKASYRKLAKNLHPDLGGDEENFKKISEAYETLSNPNKKRNYDNSRIVLNRRSSMFNDFVNDIVRGYHSVRSVENLDIVKEKIISIKEFYNGLKTTLEFSRNIIVDNEYKSINETVEINLVPGENENGLRFIYPNLGNQSKTIHGKFGNLLLFVRIKDDVPLYIKRGVNVHSQIPIPLSLALTGTEIKIKTLSGQEKIVKINSDVCFNDYPIINLKGHGFKKYMYQEVFGDHLIHLKVEIPQSLTEEEFDFLKNMSLDKYPEYKKIQKKINSSL